MALCSLVTIAEWCKPIHSDKDQSWHCLLCSCHSCQVHAYNFMLHHVKYTAVSMLQTSTQDSASHLTTLTQVVHTRHYIISDNTYTCPRKTLHHITLTHVVHATHCVISDNTYTCCPHKTLYHIGHHLHVVHTRHCIISDNLHMLSTQDIGSYTTTPTHVQIESPSWTCMLCTTEAPSWLLFELFHSCMNCSPQVFRVSSIMCTPLFILLNVLYNSSFLKQHCELGQQGTTFIFYSLPMSYLQTTTANLLFLHHELNIAVK